VSEYAIVLHGLYLSNGGRHKNEIWHSGNQWGEDDARTSNTRIAQTKRAIPHSTMNKKLS